MKRIIITLFTVFIFNPVFADYLAAPNMVTLATTSGSGYFVCEVKPRTELMSEKLRKKDLLSEDVLKGFSAHIETHCVNVSGMICQSNTGQAGTLTTNLAWLKAHYFKFEKSGKENPDDTATCGDNGIVQLMVDYTYQVQCHVVSEPPKDLQAIHQPVC